MNPRPAHDASPSRSTRCWSVVYGDDSFDVSVTAHDDEHLGTLIPGLHRLAGAAVEGLFVGPTRLPEDLPLSAPELVHGAVLGLGHPVPSSRLDDRTSALELHVVGGPAAGRTVPLDQGRHILGRSAEATVPLDDPDVSRRHVAVQITGGEVTVTDLESTNGSLLNGDDLGRTARIWRIGEVLRLGASAVTIAGPSGTGVSTGRSSGGRSQVRPTLRMRTQAPAVEITMPAEPMPPARRPLAWVAVALPALAGVLMSWILQTPTFLFFALLSPIVAVGTWLSDRWTGRRTSRKQRAEYDAALRAAEARLTAAVAADVRAAEDAQPDLAALLSGARRRSHLVWSRRLSDPDALSVRVGSGSGTTNVTRVETGGRRVRQAATSLPVVVDLPQGGGLGVVGPRGAAVSALASVVAQLAALHAPGDVDFLLLADADRMSDWTWAKWLPHLDPRSVQIGGADRVGVPRRQPDEALNSWLSDLVARRRLLIDPRPGTPDSLTRLNRLVVLVDRRLDPMITATLRAGRDVGVLVLAVADAAGELPVDVDAVLRLTGETGSVAELSRAGLPTQSHVVVDRLCGALASRFARDLARLAPAATAGALPDSVRLLDLPIVGTHVDAAGQVTGTWSRERDRLVAPLGRSAEGPVEIDLCSEGPHALIAGTTGSGKSELLQTLIAGLALRHPPDRCSFLLVDYKGGAAFAEAAELPHTVGLVTDLDAQTTARALRSLTAELTRREGVLAAHQVPDIGSLPEDVTLARLVIVVDEFATLAEELPSFVPGLVSIAQRGRSLGVHLVLATQRPSGVVSPEIRANCTLRICLRTTDDADSRDVLGTPQAALLPVDRPGRAYLRIGSSEPTALQVARVSTPLDSRPSDGPDVRLWAWPGRLPSAGAVPAPAADNDLARLTGSLRRRAELSGSSAPHRPWQPPLPDEFAPSRQAGPMLVEALQGTRLLLGLVDLPDRQIQQELELDLAEGGGWLATGGPRSGRTTLLRTVLSEAVRRLAPADLHVHVLDPSGGTLATEAAGVPHTGTTISGSDPLRTARLIDRLAAEVAARRAGPPDRCRPLILVLVDGVEAVSGQLDDVDPTGGTATLLRLMRDGAAVGVTCVLTADRAVPGGRLAAAVRQRLVLPLPDRADYAVAGVPARAVPSRRPPGRALVGEDGLECQLALPAPLPVRTDPAPSDPERPARLRIAELPPDPALDLPDAGRLPPERSGPLMLSIGPGGDEGESLNVDLLQTGGLLVTGPPGSGRSSALAAFALHLRAAGMPVLWIGRPPVDPYPANGPDARVPDDGSAWDQIGLDPHDDSGTTRWLADRTGTPCVVIADEVGAPAEVPALMALPVLGRNTGVTLVAAGTAGQFTAHYQGPVAHLRRARSGLLLCPGPGDADLLGIRLPRVQLPVRPGSGWLATRGRVERVQVARRRAPALVSVRNPAAMDLARG